MSTPSSKIMILIPSIQYLPCRNSSLKQASIYCARESSCCDSVLGHIHSYPWKPVLRSAVQPHLPLHTSHSALTSPACSLSLENRSTFHTLKFLYLLFTLGGASLYLSMYTVTAYRGSFCLQGASTQPTKHNRDT